MKLKKTVGNRTGPGGLLLVDKPEGWTSHDVVAYVKGRYRPGKVGHAGTLDPLATGLLILGLGSATKSLGKVAACDKEYLVGLLLGRRTSTGDMEGEVVEESGVCVSGEELAGAVLSIEGEIEQVPPIYSAVKYKGKPLYSYARKGMDVPRKARRVNVVEVEVLEMEVPNVLFRAVVSKGTYIRTLCEDIGKKVGCPSMMSYLRRTRIGEYYIKDAVTIDDLKRMDREMLEKILIQINDETRNPNDPF
ncbi:MAG: tRNA pseudouridine(55) synthase TruB [Candidatus Tritonobacter lacicola]|nr:tRNA pseudouridine(55) synthase TruB [Candidatus Tritonobacter lacicola]